MLCHRNLTPNNTMAYIISSILGSSTITLSRVTYWTNNPINLSFLNKFRWTAFYAFKDHCTAWKLYKVYTYDCIKYITYKIPSIILCSVLFCIYLVYVYRLVSLDVPTVTLCDMNCTSVSGNDLLLTPSDICFYLLHTHGLHDIHMSYVICVYNLFCAVILDVVISRLQTMNV